jgi:hypothetical protein
MMNISLKKNVGKTRTTRVEVFATVCGVLSVGRWINPAHPVSVRISAAMTSVFMIVYPPLEVIQPMDSAVRSATEDWTRTLPALKDSSNLLSPNQESYMRATCHRDG